MPISREQAIELPDAESAVLYLECPSSKVVELQGYFELYEGLGIVRTLSIPRSLVCVITTRSQLDSCVAALTEIQPRVGWKYHPLPEAEERERYLGYFSDASVSS